MSSEVNLKPCPFCGAFTDFGEIKINGLSYLVVQCTCCKIQTVPISKDYLKGKYDYLVDKWNKRVGVKKENFNTVQQLKAEIAEVKNDLGKLIVDGGNLGDLNKIFIKLQQLSAI